MHSSMEITDQFYSNINDNEVRNRIGGMKNQEKTLVEDELLLFKEFLEWKKR